MKDNDFYIFLVLVLCTYNTITLVAKVVILFIVEDVLIFFKVTLNNQYSGLSI